MTEGRALPDLILAAFREAMARGDHKAAEHLFRALECHSREREWQRALREAERLVIGADASARRNLH